MVDRRGIDDVTRLSSRNGWVKRVALVNELLENRGAEGGGQQFFASLAVKRRRFIVLGVVGGGHVTERRVRFIVAGSWKVGRGH